MASFMPLAQYPIGEALGFKNAVEYESQGPISSTVTAVPSALSKLANKSLDDNKYLQRLVPEVARLFKRMKKKTFPMVMPDPEAVSPVHVPVQGPSTSGFRADSDVAPLNADYVTITEICFVIKIVKNAEPAESVAIGGEPRRKRPRTSGSLICNVEQAVILFDAVLLFNTILLDLVQISISRIEPEKVTEGSNIKRLRQLKKSLLQYSRYLDEILLHYTHSTLVVELVELPALKEVIEIKTKIKSIIKQMNPKDFQKLILPWVSDNQALPEFMLCSVIGLKNSFGDRLHSLPENVKDHQSIEYFLKEFLQESYNSMDYGHLNCNDTDKHKHNLIEVLYEIGFTESRSAVIADWIGRLSNDSKEHQPLSYWIDLYLDEVFEYNVFLNHNVCPCYPYNEDKVDVWSTVPIDRDDDDADSEADSGANLVKIMNTTLGKSESLKRDGVAYPPQTEPDAYWYHGTDANHSKHILENGIQLNKGKPRMDFSDGDGFYLSPTYAAALDWAKRCANPAVIVFRIEPDILQSFVGIDLRGNEADWSKLVHHHRCGVDSKACKLPSYLKKELRQCDYIRGALCTLRGDSRKKDWRPQGFGRTDRMQLCIKSDVFARKFGRIANIDGAIFIH